MDGEWWEQAFSLLEWEVAEKQGEEASMTYVIMD